MDNEIKKTIEEVLNKLTLTFSDIEVIDNNERFIFMINTNDARFIIGNKGVNLYALNHIIKRVVDRKTNSYTTNFVVDVNSYQINRDIEIRNKTKILGERVKSFCTNIEMEPMPSYERMIVHSVFTEDSDIETESVGYGIERRIIIKFKKNST